jgi:hypothetical protein
VHPGAVGAIRDPDGYDAPFDGGDLPAGSTLIVAAYRSGDRWQVAAVSIGNSVVFFLVFEMWFKVPLPKGWFERLLGLD